MTQVDHLAPQKNHSKRNWIRGKSDDVQSVQLVQVIPVDVVGEWNFKNERQPVFSIENVDMKNANSFETFFDS